MADRCSIPISWLGPSGRARYGIRKGRTVTIADTIGTYPISGRGRTGKIVDRYPSSIMVRAGGVEYQVTGIVVPCGDDGARPFAGRRR